jgi:hypothetical protein
MKGIKEIEVYIELSCEEAPSAGQGSARQESLGILIRRTFSVEGVGVG